MDWDQGTITSLNIRREESEDTNSKYKIKNDYREFIRNFRDGNVYCYRDQLVSNYRKRLYYLVIELCHINAYKPELQNLLLDSPIQYLPLVELAAKEALTQFMVQQADNEGIKQDIQIVLQSNQTPVLLREIHGYPVNRLLKIPGIVVSASNIKAKCTSITVQCRHCGTTKVIECKGPFEGAAIPQKCDRVVQVETMENECPKDSYVVIPDRGKYIDQQTLKLQESPEVVPTGEMPRNILLSTDRFLVDKASPGTRVSIIGISSVLTSAAKGKAAGEGLRTPYIRVVGIEVDEVGAGRSKAIFTPSEEEQFHEMAKDDTMYEKIAASIAPSIYGTYTTNIKKAIACQLLGGSRKQLPDGMMLRGDINVLLLGDPSTAKSQFLKFAEKVAPVGVYTSGKGSSAAGLTASVLRDAKGDFRLEGGAMVLADGGVVCIDEFDKMRESDRVAIHEAMEQQTISIAKAGITTILNARSSVLAAANPVFGRYDDMRSAAENIDMMSTILSRFDLIFIVRDIQDESRDKMIAAHVVRVHSTGYNTREGNNEQLGEIEPQLLKKYITYCRARCAPRLSEAASQALQDFYVNIRDDVRKNVSASKEAAIPITVRQLEALVRLSESLAKMRLQIEATTDHVEEAIRLFRVSTMNASNEGGTSGLFTGYHIDAEKVEGNILQSLRINQRVQTDALYSKLEAQVR